MGQCEWLDPEPVHRFEGNIIVEAVDVQRAALPPGEMMELSHLPRIAEHGHLPPAGPRDETVRHMIAVQVREADGGDLVEPDTGADFRQPAIDGARAKAAVDQEHAVRRAD